jgi:hypothetical protein
MSIYGNTHVDENRIQGFVNEIHPKILLRSIFQELVFIAGCLLATLYFTHLIVWLLCGYLIATRLVAISTLTKLAQGSRRRTTGS